MTHFGWKRKINDKVKVNPDVVEELQSNDEGERVSGLSQQKRKRNIEQEPHILAVRLKDEGILFAEQGRLSEAIDSWSRALQLTPTDPKIYEMMSQVQQEKGDYFASVLSAEQAVKLDPVWCDAYQTLGRAQLNIGEVKLALLNFLRALHFNPSAHEIKNEDISWTLSLLSQSSQHSPSQEMETSVERIRVRRNS